MKLATFRSSSTKRIRIDLPEYHRTLLRPHQTKRPLGSGAVSRPQAGRIAHHWIGHVVLCGILLGSASGMGIRFPPSLSRMFPCCISVGVEGLANSLMASSKTWLVLGPTLTSTVLGGNWCVPISHSASIPEPCSAFSKAPHSAVAVESHLPHASQAFLSVGLAMRNLAGSIS